MFRAGSAQLLIIKTLMPTTLEQILASTRQKLQETRQYVSAAKLERQAREHHPRGFAAALTKQAARGTAIIAELKKASPSKGLIRASFHPASLALDLVKSGAAALSVLTDEPYFQGSLDYLDEVSAAVSVPLLRKDFIIDEFQLLEARAHCADAVLLIAAALSERELRSLYKKAVSLGLDVLCEVHDEHELAAALDAGCDIIGVNSRNLHTFEVDLNTSLQLAPKISPDKIRVAESGIVAATDIAILKRAGFQAFLVGETLMKADYPGQALSELLRNSGVPR